MADDIENKKIQVSGQKLLLLIVLSLIFTGIALWLFIAGGRIYHFTPFLAKTTGLFGAILFGVMSFFFIKRYLAKSAGLEINDKGIIDNSQNSIMIHWSDITELKKEEMFGSRFILVMVKNPEEYFKGSNFFERIFMEWNFRTYGTPITLSAGSLKCSFGELYNKLNQGLVNFHIRKNNR